MKKDYSVDEMKKIMGKDMEVPKSVDEYSIYGAATNKPLNSDACIAMSMATVKKISGRWQIVKEFTMYSIDEIRDTCTAEDAPGAAAEEVAK